MMLNHVNSSVRENKDPLLICVKKKKKRRETESTASCVISASLSLSLRGGAGAIVHGDAVKKINTK